MEPIKTISLSFPLPSRALPHFFQRLHHSRRAVVLPGGWTAAREGFADSISQAHRRSGARSSLCSVAQGALAAISSRQLQLARRHLLRRVERP